MFQKWWATRAIRQMKYTIRDSSCIRHFWPSSHNACDHPRMLPWPGSIGIITKYSQQKMLVRWLHKNSDQINQNIPAQAWLLVSASLLLTRSLQPATFNRSKSFSQTMQWYIFSPVSFLPPAMFWDLRVAFAFVQGVELPDIRVRETLPVVWDFFLRHMLTELSWLPLS